jgi:hypothetical protein
MMIFIAPQNQPSWLGLTRPSIRLRETSFAQVMDCRVKPGNDDKHYNTI